MPTPTTPTSPAWSEYEKLKIQLAEYDASLNELKNSEVPIEGFLTKSTELLGKRDLISMGIPPISSILDGLVKERDEAKDALAKGNAGPDVPAKLIELNTQITELEKTKQDKEDEVEKLNKQISWVANSFSFEKENVDAKGLNAYIDAYDKATKLNDLVMNTSRAADKLLAKDMANANSELTQAKAEQQKAIKFKRPEEMKQAEERMDNATAVLANVTDEQDKIATWRSENLSNAKSILDKGYDCFGKTNASLFEAYKRGVNDNLAYLEPNNKNLEENNRSGKYGKKVESKEYYLDDLEKLSAPTRQKQNNYRQILPEYVANIIPKNTHIKGNKSLGIIGKTDTEERTKKVTDFLNNPPAGQSREVQAKKLKELLSNINIVLDDKKISNILDKRDLQLSAKDENSFTVKTRERASHQVITKPPEDRYTLIRQKEVNQIQIKQEKDDTPALTTSTVRPKFR